MTQSDGNAPQANILRLYITGRTPRSERAIQTLKTICEGEMGGSFQLVIVDVLENPQLAEDEKILATPTVVKELPPPIRRIIGDMTNTERVLLGLDLSPVKKNDEKEKE